MNKDNAGKTARDADAALSAAGLPTYTELLEALRMHQDAACFVADQFAIHKATRAWGGYHDGSYMTVRIATASCKRVRDAAEIGAGLLAKIGS